MKKLFFSILLISALFSRELPFPWVVYEDQIRYYLDGRSYEIDGKFYSYDFDGDGIIFYDDWIYISQNGSIYRLFGVNPTSNNRFGWQEIELPQDFQTKGEFQGYFIYINYPNDRDHTYSWIYIKRNGNIYKLLSNHDTLHPDNFLRKLPFEHIDLLSLSMEDNKVNFSIPFSLPPFKLSSYTEGDDIEITNNPKTFNLFILGYQKLIGEWIRVASKEFIIPYTLLNSIYTEEVKNEIDDIYQKELESFKRSLDKLFQNRLTYQDFLVALKNQGQIIVFQDYAKATNWNLYKKEATQCSGEGSPGNYEKLSFDSQILSITTLLKSNPYQGYKEIVEIRASSSLPDLVIRPISIYKGCIIVLSIQTGCPFNGNSYNRSYDLLCRIYKEKE